MSTKFLKNFFIFFLITCSSAFANTDKIGMVKTVSKKAELSKNENQHYYQLKINDLVFMGETIKTDNSGSVGIIFSDGGVLTIGSNSKITVSDYLFDPINKKGSMKLSVFKGQVIYSSGAINRIVPGSIQIITPNNKMTLIGTKVIIEVN